MSSMTSPQLSFAWQQRRSSLSTALVLFRERLVFLARIKTENRVRFISKGKDVFTWYKNVVLVNVSLYNQLASVARHEVKPRASVTGFVFVDHCLISESLKSHQDTFISLKSEIRTNFLGSNATPSNIYDIPTKLLEIITNILFNRPLTLLATRPFTALHVLKLEIASVKRTVLYNKLQSNSYVCPSNSLARYNVKTMEEVSTRS
ncbi:hypothetical protein OUZ56_020919 [Daphnia magna]|uniref:F-box domain-containing protein n=1 Tax=Daphnia magna TaxID=35525 RepID=A0ABQ9ZFV6_9CRUS|nr:hypothetical protein OUZ56_020919 [Daphnia magna]